MSTAFYNIPNQLQRPAERGSIKEVFIRVIREIRGNSAGPHSGWPRITRFHASFDSLKLRSNATSGPVMFLVILVS